MSEPVRTAHLGAILPWSVFTRCVNIVHVSHTGEEGCEQVLCLNVEERSLALCGGTHGLLALR